MGLKEHFRKYSLIVGVSLRTAQGRFGDNILLPRIICKYKTYRHSAAEEKMTFANKS